MPDPGTRKKRLNELFLPQRSIQFTEDSEILLKI